MPRKRKSAESSSDRPLPPVAAMKFWSRFQTPRPALAFTFLPSIADVEGEESLGRLTRIAATSVPDGDSAVYSLRISLDRSKPTIWRRVHTNTVNLEELHRIIQLTMGWQDSHLHNFEVRKTRVPLVEDWSEINERGIFLAQMFAARIKTFYYIYDFADDWRHTITIEKSMPGQSASAYPYCVAGKGTCPPEDIGGIDGWTRLISGLQRSEKDRDPSFYELLNRTGSDYFPAPFDLESTNARLTGAFKKRVRRKGRL